MDNGTLPYLKDIAESLGGISKGTSAGGTRGRGEVSVSGNLDTSGIVDELDKGLVGLVEEQQGSSTVEVEKSQFEILGDEIADILHRAFFMTVNNTEVSAFAYMHDRLAWLATLGISDIIQHLSLNVVDEGLSTEHLELLADIPFRSLGNVTAGAIGASSGSAAFPTVLDDWDDYGDGTGGTTDTRDWVPNAEIVYTDRTYFYAQIQQLWNAISGGGGGGGSTLTFGLEMPTGFTVTGSPADPDVTITVGLATGYVIPTQDQLAGLSYFVPVTDTNDDLIGIKSIHDLYIIQTEADDTTNPATAEVIKNVTELLRRETYVPAVAEDLVLETPARPEYLSFDLGIVSSGNITAGAVSADPALSNQILYRLDDWDDYGDGTGGTTDTRDWVPSAELVKESVDDITALDTRVTALENSGGQGTSNVNWVAATETSTTVELDVDGTTKALAKAGAYLPLADFQAVFNVQPTSVAIVVATGQSTRDLSVPGNIVATGNVTAGAVSADPALSNQILYRLDDWDDYVAGSGSGSTEDWVPSAALVYALRQQMLNGGYDDTNVWNAITALQNVDAGFSTRISDLEALPRIEYVKPNQTWPPTPSSMVDNWFYVKLSQTA
jgi:hypothetical protein